MRIKYFGLAVAVAAAVPAAAVQTVTITSAGIYNPGTTDATVGGTTKSEYATAVTLTGIFEGAVFDAIGFCVDLPHNIYVNIGAQLQQTLNFHVAQLMMDGYGNPLTSTQVREIAGLASLGFDINDGTAADKPAQLAAIQQAIWTIEYPTSTFVATGPYAAAQAGYAAGFIAQAPTLHGHVANIASDDGTIQGQVINLGVGLGGSIGSDAGAVPEPAMWAMMLAGFGAVGVLSRRRRETLQMVAA